MPQSPEQIQGHDRAEAVGAIIRRRRQARGLTLRAFARQCDISPAHLSKVERGLASPSLTMLTRMVQELDLHGADLFGLAAEEERGMRVVLGAGRPGHVLPQRTSDRQVIVIVLEGAAEARVGDELIELGEGDTLIVPAHSPHTIRVTGGPTTRTVYISSDDEEPAFEPPTSAA